MTTIGERIRQLRKQAKLSQTQLALLLGIDHSTISKYERGERKVPMDMLVPLAKTLKVSTDYLLGNSDKRYLDSDNEKIDYNDIKINKEK